MKSGFVQRWIRPVVIGFARTFGSTIVDHETGRVLGRALLLVWRGKIHLIGLEARVIPVFLPQQRLTYWRQTIGFAVHPPPDFPRAAASRAGEG